MSKQSVSVLGCGWLGLPLSKTLQQVGYSVKGSSTSKSKLEALKRNKIQPFHLDFNPQVDGEGIDEFFNSQVLFLNIPYKRSLKDPYFYKDQVIEVVKYVEKSSIEFVIFASSTSVYPSHMGLAGEEMGFSPDSVRAKVLLEIEEMLLGSNRFQTTILRFAGLYGNDRRIGKFLAGKKDIEKGRNPVNLIHLDDCIAIIKAVIEQNVRGDVFNAVSDFHPTRLDLYTKAALEMDLEPPTFMQDKDTGHKIVLNDKIKKALNYQFQHSDPMDDVSAKP